jgi:hypothetical protein
MLTRDETWISKTDLFRNFEQIPIAIPNQQLRALVSNYFESVLPRKEKDKAPTQQEKAKAVGQVIAKYPEIIDYYIKMKEESGERAVSRVLQRYEIRRECTFNSFALLSIS